MHVYECRIKFDRKIRFICLPYKICVNIARPIIALNFYQNMSHLRNPPLSRGFMQIIMTIMTAEKTNWINYVF